MNPIATSASVPWDKIVEFFWAGPGLRISREHMSLQQAVRRYLRLDEQARRSTGIGMHEPYLTTIEGRPVAVGFLNAAALEELAARDDFVAE